MAFTTPTTLKAAGLTALALNEIRGAIVAKAVLWPMLVAVWAPLLHGGH